MSTVLSRTSKLLNSRTYSDVTFLVKERKDSKPVKFFCHKLVLALISPLFAKWFYDQSPHLNEYEERNISSKAFYMMLQFIYTDEVEIQTLEEAYKLNDVAKRYEISELEELSGKIINTCEISIETFFDLYKIAIDENMVSLYQQCQVFLSENTKVILKSPLFLDAPAYVIEEIIKQDELSVDSELDVIYAVMNWGRNKCGNKGKCLEFVEMRNHIDNFIKYLRFLTITVEEFQDFAEIFDVLTARESVNITMKLLGNNVELLEHFSSNTDHRNSAFLNNKKYPKTKVKHAHPVPQLENHINSASVTPIASNDSIPNLVAASVQNWACSNLTEENLNYAKNENSVKNRSPPQEAQNVFTAVTVEKRTFEFPLQEIPKTIATAFERDITSTIEIVAEEGHITVHGLVLRVKEKNILDEIITVLLQFSVNSVRSQEDKYHLPLKDNNLTLMLNEPIQVPCKGKALIVVEVDSLQLQRAYTCNQNRFQLNFGLNSTLKVTLKSNREYDFHGLFLISRIIYSV